MRYSSLKTIPMKEFAKERFDGGLNTYNKEDLILENQMSDGSNVLFENGTLISRKGLSFNIDNALESYDDYSFFHKGLTVTDAKLLKDNQIHRVAYTVCGDRSSYQMLTVYLISPEGTTVATDKIEIRRTSYDIYYMFDNIIFLVGTKKSGCGLYAFLSRKSGLNDIFEIYELDSAYNKWIRLYEQDFYIPVVYLNGHGNRYHDALAQGNISAQNTTKPESLNMLSPRFRAYFTSDGYSTLFKLPIKQLSADSTIVCRSYISPNNYREWIIPAFEESVTALTDLGNITMRCYRDTGYLSFYDENGTSIAIPISSVTSNNLLVEASRLENDGLAEVMGCKLCQIYNSNVFFYKNPQNPSRIYLAQIDNPLYFPENMKKSVGNPSDYVTAMAVQNNKLIAFKSSEIYLISIKKNDSELLLDGLVGSTVTSFEDRQITQSLIHGSVGCAKKETLTVCGNRLVWLSIDYRVYTLATTTYGKENNVYCVSTPIGNILKSYSEGELKNAFAFDHNGYYVLYIEQSLYMLNYRIKNFGISAVYTALGDHGDSISWYVMKLPYQKYYSGYSNGDKIYLSCVDLLEKYCVIATLDGEKDMVLAVEDGKVIQKELSIESNITTKFFTLGNPNIRKNIEEVCICMDFSGEADIILNDADTEYKQTIFSAQKSSSPIKLMPHFKGVYGVSISVSAKSPISFKGIYIKYKNLI